ncbi:hypothetical protein M409DRAFT_28833 [Zasmidium cellare ATCC 36951]|uniref:Uncharacterized protein n=1 Tax=Zasmidium cellare ATCC 36951 TaxID=1080233 RepID=A0A6A6C1F3_ZASCE|nr:uncharacterized protein M409DRAFT_28833 [Zasmidium cellare ATCC 36951]KAF2160693.1 hypothetical protein M409DRAFT_28833 [Zasmidium cellare ATCC 36951]
MAEDESTRRKTITFPPSLSLKPPSVIQRPSTGGTTSSEEEEAPHPRTPTPTKPPPPKWKDRCKKFLGLSTPNTHEAQERGRGNEREGDMEFGVEGGIKPYNEKAAASLPEIISARRWRRPSPYPDGGKRPQATRSKTAPQIRVFSPEEQGQVDQRQGDGDNYDGEEWGARALGT